MFSKKIFLSFFFNLLLSGNTPTPKLYGNTDCDIQIELYNNLTFDISSLNTIEIFINLGKLD